MPLLLIIPALFLPRLVMFLLWVFSSWFTGVFSFWLWGFIGFLCMPYTTLWYSTVHHWYGSTWGPFQIIVLVIAVIADLGLLGESQRRKK